MPVEHGFRTILVLDIEQYGRLDRDDQVRVVLRRGLLDVITQALTDAGVTKDQWTATSTGDGLLVGVVPTVPTARIVRMLLDYMPTGLTQHNRFAAEVARIRARAVVHAAHVLHDDQGLVGRQVNLAFRLVDSDPLRALLTQTTGPLVVAVSEDVYEHVVRQRHLGLDPESFAPVQVQAKEARTRMWVHPPTPVDPGRVKVARGPVMLRVLRDEGAGTQPDTVFEDRADSVSIGRAEHMAIRLDDPRVSFEHGRIEFTHGRLVYRHLGKNDAVLERTGGEQQLLSRPEVVDLRGNDRLRYRDVVLTVQFSIDDVYRAYRPTQSATQDEDSDE